MDVLFSINIKSSKLDNIKKCQISIRVYISPIYGKLSAMQCVIPISDELKLIFPDFWLLHSKEVFPVAERRRQTFNILLHRQLP